MNRPLETTFWMRLRQFLKGVFFYNTFYWRRASDDLEIHRMSREERASLRPKRNLEIIRPRERARAHVTNAVLSLPPEYDERPTSALFPAAQISEPTAGPAAAPAPAIPDEGGEVEIHRRKKRRRSRHSKVMPKRYYDGSINEGGRGILGWLFKR